MAESNIAAYFRSPEQAKSAAAKLRSLRIQDMSIDRVGGTNPRFTGNEFSMEASAEPDHFASQSVMTQFDICLTAFVDDSVKQQTLKVIEEAGGMV